MGDKVKEKKTKFILWVPQATTAALMGTGKDFNSIGGLNIMDSGGQCLWAAGVGVAQWSKH